MKSVVRRRWCGARGAPAGHGRQPLLLWRMSVRVGFLRAVNLGAHRRVPMTRLVAVCEGLEYADVWTYVNSGNVVFDTTGARASVEAAIQKALEAEFGFECTTFVRTAKQLGASSTPGPSRWQKATPTS